MSTGRLPVTKNTIRDYAIPSSLYGVLEDGIAVERIKATDGSLNVSTDNNGHICVDNSSSTPLDGGGEFTGEWEDTLNYNTITVGISTDQDSATDGLEVQWSTDASTVNDSDVFTVLANTGKVFTFSPARRYVRIMYTNGGTDQTELSLETTLKKGGFKPSSHRISDSIVADDDAELNKAVLTGEDEDGVFQNVNVTRDGDLTISDNSSGLAISEGNVTGKTFVHKFGYAPDFDYGDGEVTVWDGSDDGGINQMTYQYSTTAIIDSISSSSTADTMDIQLQGLDANFDLVTQNVTLNGQTRVALGTNLIRIFRMKNNGTVDLVGNAYVYENTALTGGVPNDRTKIRSLINNGNNQTLMAVYTVPQDKVGYLRDWYASTAGSSKDSQYIIRLWARSYNEGLGVYNAWQLKHITSISDVGTSYVQHKYEEPETFIGKVDIRMTVEATAVGASGASISAGFDVVLVNN